MDDGENIKVKKKEFQVESGLPAEQNYAVGKPKNFFAKEFIIIISLRHKTSLSLTETYQNMRLKMRQNQMIKKAKTPT